MHSSCDFSWRPAAFPHFGKAFQRFLWWLQSKLAGYSPHGQCDDRGVIGTHSQVLDLGTCLTVWLEVCDVGVYPLLGTNDLYTLPLNLAVTTLSFLGLSPSLLWEIVSSKTSLCIW